MALTGLEIFKQLPKTNCKDCGHPTCLAFAMALASGKIALDKCPHISDAAREMLDSASAPPIATIKIGVGENEVTIGGETVLYRHDKRFENNTGIAITVRDNDDSTSIAERIKNINNLFFDRIGQVHGVNLIAIDNTSGVADKFVEAVKIALENTDLPLILATEDLTAAQKALEFCASRKPLLYGATDNNYEAMAKIALSNDIPLGIKGKDLNNLAELVEKIQKIGCKKLVLDPGRRQINQTLSDQTQIRRQALRKFRTFGYPTLAQAINNDPVQSVIEASVYIVKYASIVIFPSADPAEVLPLITLRLNIFTDPQKPIAVEPKLYEVGTPDENSPVFITTNFSLSFFCVQGDIESARISAYILPVDTDGVSVLTGWAAGKFTPEKIAQMLQETNMADRVKHKTIIIPGGIATLSNKLEEISGWKVIVGPLDSAGIPGFIKQILK